MLERLNLRTAVTMVLLTAPTLLPATPVTAAGLESLKALEGDWFAVADGEMVKIGDHVSSIRVTASGTAVVETDFPGTDHEMVTVYIEEGGDLVLTHYCMAGNQPRMRASNVLGPRFEFAFDGGDNIADASKDQHMHSAWLEIVGANEIRSEWTEYKDGKPGLVVPMHLTRPAN